MANSFQEDHGAKLGQAFSNLCAVQFHKIMEQDVTLKHFYPENELEQAIVKIKSGLISVEEMMGVFFESPIYVISKSEAAESGSVKVHEDWRDFSPLRFNIDGDPMTAIFSSLNKARSHDHRSESILKILGREHILRVPSGNGFVLNAGYDAQIKVIPSGVQEMRDHLMGKETLKDFQPENELEEAILAVRNGERDVSDVLDALAISDVYIVSKRDIQRDWTGFDPLLFVEDNVAYIEVFSSLQRPDVSRPEAKHVLQISAKELIKRILPEYGLIVNPGYFAYFLVEPRGVAEFRQKYVNP